jgi:hypothetical protein
MEKKASLNGYDYAEAYCAVTTRGAAFALHIGLIRNSA